MQVDKQLFGLQQNFTYGLFHLLWKVNFWMITSKILEISVVFYYIILMKEACFSYKTAKLPSYMGTKSTIYSQCQSPLLKLVLFLDYYFRKWSNKTVS